MNQVRKFIGRAYDAHAIECNEAALRTWATEGAKPLEGELEKSAQHLEMIDAANSFIEAELRELGFDGYQPAPAAQVRLLPKEVYENLHHDPDERGFYRSTRDQIRINMGWAETSAELFALVTHELLHRASTLRFYENRRSAIEDARVGYRLSSSWKGPAREDRLRGFNELMVTFATFKILHTNRAVLRDRFGITEEEIDAPIYPYMQYGNIIAAIMEKMKVDNGMSAREAFMHLEKGLFDTNILAIKVIEKSFGKGALGVLSLLGTLEGQDDDTLDSMITEYFTEKDDTARMGIRNRILAFFDEAMKRSLSATKQGEVAAAA